MCILRSLHFCGTDNLVLSVICHTPLPSSTLCCPAALPTAVSRPEREEKGSGNCGEEEEQPGHSCRVQSFSFLPALTFHPMGTVLVLTTAKIPNILGMTMGRGRLMMVLADVKDIVCQELKEPLAGLLQESSVCYLLGGSGMRVTVLQRFSKKSCASQHVCVVFPLCRICSHCVEDAPCAGIAGADSFFPGIPSFTRACYFWCLSCPK